MSLKVEEVFYKASDIKDHPNSSVNFTSPDNGEALIVSRFEDKEFDEKFPGIIISDEKVEGRGHMPKYIGWLWDVQTLGNANLLLGKNDRQYFQSNKF